MRDRTENLRKYIFCLSEMSCRSISVLNMLSIYFHHKHFAKYVGAQANSSILFRWSVGGESKEPLFTKFKDIMKINDSTISTGWALKHNKL